MKSNGVIKVAEINESGCLGDLVLIYISFRHQSIRRRLNVSADRLMNSADEGVANVGGQNSPPMTCTIVPAMSCSPQPSARIC